MSVRPVDSAALRVTATALPLRYDLRWYDGSESIVPLWWLGVWGPGADDLFRTEVLQGPLGVSPGQLYDWLVGAVSPVGGEPTGGRRRRLRPRWAAVGVLIPLGRPPGRPAQARTSATRACRRGTSSSSNQGCSFNHRLLRGLGCGRGTTSGQWSRQDPTTSLTEPPASGRW